MKLRHFFGIFGAGIAAGAGMVHNRPDQWAVLAIEWGLLALLLGAFEWGQWWQRRITAKASEHKGEDG